MKFNYCRPLQERILWLRPLGKATIVSPAPGKYPSDAHRLFLSNQGIKCLDEMADLILKNTIILGESIVKLERDVVW